MDWSPTSILSVILAISVPLTLVVGYLNRKERKRSIGWQFIRYTVVVISLLIIGVLALNDVLSGEAAALIGGAMGYAFGKRVLARFVLKYTLRLELQAARGHEIVES